MSGYTAKVINAEKYLDLTGLDKKINEVVEHNKEEMLLLVKEKCVELTQLSKKRLEKKVTESLMTPDELDDSIELDVIAHRLSEASNFPKIARKAVMDIGIYHDNEGYWWSWDDSSKSWRECDITDIYNSIDSRISDSSNSIEPKIKGLLKEALERQARLQKPLDLDWHWIQFKDKLINFDTLEEMPASKKYFISNPIPWNIGESEETPVLDDLLDSWTNNKELKKRDINELKDLFAFSLPTKYFIRSVPFCYGRGSDGKTQFTKTLEKFVGKHNCVGTTLNYLENSQFGTYPLMKKLVCFLSEIPKNEIKGFTTCKMISGGDPAIPVEKKGCDRKSIELYSKLILIGNDVPISSDQSDGFFNRIMLLQFPNSFPDGPDVFEKIPDKEFENLCKWSLRRLKEITQSYKLTANKNSLEARKEEYKRESNQVFKFLKEQNYVISGKVNDSIMVYELLNEFNRWADERNKGFMSMTEFKAKLENAGLHTDLQSTMIAGQKTNRLFVYGIKREVPKTDISIEFPKQEILKDGVQ